MTRYGDKGGYLVTVVWDGLRSGGVFSFFLGMLVGSGKGEHNVYGSLSNCGIISGQSKKNKNVFQFTLFYCSIKKDTFSFTEQHLSSLTSNFHLVNKVFR